MRSGVNQPRSPPLLLEPCPWISRLASAANFAPFSSSPIELLGELLGGHQDVPRVVFEARQGGHLRLVLRAQFLLGRLLVLQIPLRDRLLQHVEARQLEQADCLGSLVRPSFSACCAISSARTRLSSARSRCSAVQLGRGLAGDAFRVDIEEARADRLAVDGRHGGFAIGGCGAWRPRRPSAGRPPARAGTAEEAGFVNNSCLFLSRLQV